MKTVSDALMAKQLLPGAARVAIDRVLETTEFPGRVASLVRDVGAMSGANAHLPKVPGKRPKPGEREAYESAKQRAEAAQSWEKQARQGLQEREAALTSDALKAKGIADGDAVRYKGGVYDGRSGETTDEEIVAPIHRSGDFYQLHHEGGLLFLDHEDVAKSSA